MPCWPFAGTDFLSCATSVPNVPFFAGEATNEES